MEEEQDNRGNEAPRPQTKSLRSLVRPLLYKYHEKTISNKHIKGEVNDATKEEIYACLIISNLIMPYIPQKPKFYSAVHQIPIYLMANQILQAVGYHKFYSMFSPLPNPDVLYTLLVDAPTLFSILSTNKKHHNLDLYDFEGYAIVSRHRAMEEKAVFFGSVFDMDTIELAMRSYGLDFNYTMYILPGMMTVRINVIKKGTNEPTASLKTEAYFEPSDSSETATSSKATASSKISLKFNQEKKRPDIKTL